MKLTLEDRFWSRVEKSVGCWTWIGRVNSDGYGQISVHGKSMGAHRLSWVIHNGELSEHQAKLVVMHECDNPRCVNPDHLLLGTIADNNRDRHQKGRTKNIEEGRSAHHARQRALTHCKHGHEYTESNTRYRKTGHRYCGECHRLQTETYLQKHRNAHNARRKTARHLAKEIQK